MQQSNMICIHVYTNLEIGTMVRLAYVHNFSCDVSFQTIHDFAFV